MKPGNAGLTRETVWPSRWVSPDSSNPAQLLVLSFFGSWCAPCFDHDLPTLSRWSQLYAAQGLRVAGISVLAADQSRDSALQDTRAQLARRGQTVHFPLLFPRTHRVRRILIGSGAKFPLNLVFNSSGKLIYRSPGVGNLQEELERLKLFLEERLTNQATSKRRLSQR